MGGLIAPAIHMAEAGTPVPDMIAHYIRGAWRLSAIGARRLEDFDHAIHTYGDGPANGAVFQQSRSRAHLSHDRGRWT